MIISVSPKEQAAFLKKLTADELSALPYLFEFWALPHQLPPSGDWRTWIIMGGRGAGKTRAGAEWVRSIAEGAAPEMAGSARRIAIVADTLDQARDISVFGESGIMSLSPPSYRPQWLAGRKMLAWPNGATAQIFSASDPESLRGPQFDAAWADEMGKWRCGQEAWDMLQFGLRLGEHPRACVTTTPRNVGVLKRLLKQKGTVVTTARTQDNAANLAPSFLEEMKLRYAGTRLGRQELDGELLVDTQGALWAGEQLRQLQVETVPELTRVVVAIDPPVSGHAGSDACGIIVAGAVLEGPPHQWRAYVLEDASVQGLTPSGWAKAALGAADRHGANLIVAEVNQGGQMVEEIIRQIDPVIGYRAVHASNAKAARAEPIAALYEQGRVRHVRGLSDLEDQMTDMTVQGFVGRGSPDRVDALVWAMHDLLIRPARKWREPRMRTI